MNNVFWCHSGDGENFDSDLFETREEAIVDAESRYCDGYTKEFYIGQARKYVPCIDVDVLIGHIVEVAWEECGDYANDYLECVEDGDKAKLEKLFNETFRKWARETDNEPTFYTVVSIEKIQGGTP